MWPLGAAKTPAIDGTILQAKSKTDYLMPLLSALCRPGLCCLITIMDHLFSFKNVKIHGSLTHVKKYHTTSTNGKFSLFSQPVAALVFVG